MKKRLSILTLIVMFLVCLIPLNVRAEKQTDFLVSDLISTGKTIKNNIDNTNISDWYKWLGKIRYYIEIKQPSNYSKIYNMIHSYWTGCTNKMSDIKTETISEIISYLSESNKEFYSYNGILLNQKTINQLQELSQQGKNYCISKQFNESNYFWLKQIKTINEQNDFFLKSDLLNIINSITWNSDYTIRYVHQIIGYLDCIIDLSKPFEICNGWQKSENNWYFITNGKKTIGWKYINKKWYYFDTNGIMVTGYQKIKNKIYYFTKNGNMAVGWKKLYEYFDGYNSRSTYNEPHWYYFHTDGSLAMNEYIQGYFLNYEGIMDNDKFAWKKYVYEDNHWEWRFCNLTTHTYITSKDWVKINNKYYFFDDSGNLYGNFYIGDNINGFYWVDKNGTWSYKAKLQQLDSKEYITNKNRIWGNYKDNYGFIPNGSYIIYYNNDYDDYYDWWDKYHLVTFKNGTVTNVESVSYNEDKHYFSVDNGNYKLVQNNHGQVISKQRIYD